jgi:hypothetical protein
MRSLADDLKAEDRERLLAMTPAERVARALALGKRDREIFGAAHGLNPEDARRVLDRQRHVGRRLSCCLEELIG